MVFKKGWNKKDKATEAKVEVASVEVVTITPEQPKVTNFSIEKDKGLWRLVVSEVQGDKVTGRKVIECENKAHALEKFKIKFAEHYFLGK